MDECSVTRNEGLTDPQLRILHSLSIVHDIEKLAKETKIPLATLGIEVARLQLNGYVADDGSLTVKGKEAIGQ